MEKPPRGNKISKIKSETFRYGPLNSCSIVRKDHQSTTRNITTELNDHPESPVFRKLFAGSFTKLDFIGELQIENRYFQKRHQAFGIETYRNAGQGRRRMLFCQTSHFYLNYVQVSLQKQPKRVSDAYCFLRFVKHRGRSMMISSAISWKCADIMISLRGRVKSHFKHFISSNSSYVCRILPVGESHSFRMTIQKITHQKLLLHSRRNIQENILSGQHCPEISVLLNIQGAYYENK